MKRQINQEIVKQIDELLKEFDRAKRSSKHTDLSGGLSDDELMEIQTRFMAAIYRFSPLGSYYIENARNVKGHNGYKVLYLAGILRALKKDIELGYIQKTQELLHAAVFDDFLDMAAELLKKGYKDPAAVIAGSVLEEHIKKVATKVSIDLLNEKGKRKKFDILVIELVKEGAISEPQRKILVSWYAQRSEAAHGNYKEVVTNEVERMIEGIRDFLIRLPA